MGRHTSAGEAPLQSLGSQGLGAPARLGLVAAAVVVVIGAGVLVAPGGRPLAAALGREGAVPGGRRGRPRRARDAGGDGRDRAAAAGRGAARRRRVREGQRPRPGGRRDRRERERPAARPRAADLGPGLADLGREGLELADGAERPAGQLARGRRDEQGGRRAPRAGPQRPPSWNAVLRGSRPMAVPDIQTEADSLAALIALWQTLGKGPEADHGGGERRPRRRPRAGADARRAAFAVARSGSVNSPVIPATEQAVTEANRETGVDEHGRGLPRRGVADDGVPGDAGEGGRRVAGQGRGRRAACSHGSGRRRPARSRSAAASARRRASRARARASSHGPVRKLFAAGPAEVDGMVARIENLVAAVAAPLRDRRLAVDAGEAGRRRDADPARGRGPRGSAPSCCRTGRRPVRGSSPRA